MDSKIARAIASLWIDTIKGCNYCTQATKYGDNIQSDDNLSIYSDPSRRGQTKGGTLLRAYTLRAVS